MATRQRSESGCTFEEIDDLERRHGVKLPDDYRQFLEESGRDNPHYCVGSDWTFDLLDDLQIWADKLMTESGVGPLPNGAFVFMMHQGYQFLFFWNGGVYYYMEGEPAPVRRYDSFDDFKEDAA